MLTLPEKVYLAGGSTDLRKSIDGLAALVQKSFQLDPFAPCLFVCVLQSPARQTQNALLGT